MAPHREAHAQDGLPAVLQRINPSIVQIHVGSSWGSGFVYPTPSHVVTAYSVINHSGKPIVLFGDGTVLSARVVAWSEPDDVALLELERPTRAAPLVLSHAIPLLGDELVVLGYPRRAKADEEALLLPRAVPTPRFGRVSFGEGKLGLDFTYWLGEAGAPIVLASGEVVGVLPAPGETTRGVLEATRPGGLEELRAEIGRRKFSPNVPVAQGGFAGLFVTPLESQRLQGAGLLTGYRYGILALTLTEFALQSGFAPAADGTFHAHTQLGAELYGTLDWQFEENGKLCVGAGGRLFWDLERTRFIAEQGRKTNSTTQVRPTAVIQMAENNFIAGVTIEPIRPAARIDIGLVFGR